LKKENVNIIDIYDFPFYDIRIETGFSIFITKEEKRVIDNYVSRKKHNNKGSKERNNEEHNARFNLVS